MVDVDNLTDSTPQDLKGRSKNEVVLKHPQFQGRSDALSSLLQRRHAASENEACPIRASFPPDARASRTRPESPGIFNVSH